MTETTHFSEEQEDIAFLKNQIKIQIIEKNIFTRQWSKKKCNQNHDIHVFSA